MLHAIRKQKLKRYYSFGVETYFNFNFIFISTPKWVFVVGGGIRNFSVKRETNMALLVTPSGDIADSPLTLRERAVLELMAKGLRQRQIAEELSIKMETVKKHIKNAYKKLGVHNKVDALRKAGIW